QVMAIGLGLMALLLLTLVRADLLQSWKKSLPPEAPNRFLVNIQPDQIAELQGFFSAQDLAAPVLFPMVRGRLTQINDKPVSSRDFADDRARRLVDREFNLSWSASMQPDNVIVEGRWFDASQAGEPLVSVEEGIATTLGLKLGDRLTYQIAGRKLTVTIASLRRVQWDTFKVNFFVVAAPGVLESHPATFVTSLHLPDSRSATMEALVEKFPNLVVIDVAAILAQVKSMIDQVASAIEFVFVFSLAAGLLVLWAGIASTQDERMIDAAVMRALGASRRQLRAIHSAEFVLLGALAGLLAAAGATALGYVLATRVLEVPFTWNPWVGLAGIGAGALGVRFAGLLGTAKVLKTPPTEVFRAAA
ncbi:MAG: ABC transporter permease, partial [Burkholderiales bacterium]